MNSQTDQLPSEVTCQSMYKMSSGNGTSTNEGNTEHGNSYGTDGNQGNGKGNLNPHCTPVSDGISILLLFVLVYSMVKNRLKVK